MSITATFKPTAFKFSMEDRYFVQVQYFDKAKDGFDICEIVGVFEHLTDAKAFAHWRLTEDSRVLAKAVWIFTRDDQVEVFRRPMVAA